MIRNRFFLVSGAFRGPTFGDGPTTVEAPNLREPGTCPGASQMMPALSKQWQIVLFSTMTNKKHPKKVIKSNNKKVFGNEILDLGKFHCFFFNSWFYLAPHFLSILSSHAKQKVETRDTIVGSDALHYLCHWTWQLWKRRQKTPSNNWSWEFNNPMEYIKKYQMSQKSEIGTLEDRWWICTVLTLLCMAYGMFL